MNRLLLTFLLGGAIIAQIGDTTNVTNDNTCKCVPIEYILRYQCPPFTDMRCVRAWTRTRSSVGAVDCTLVEPRNETDVMMVEARELIDRLQQTDAYGRPVCSLVMFYSVDCIFSRRIAGYVYSLAQLFPHLRVYALNVHQKSTAMDQLINQHGIAATPVLFLFENQIARSRFHDGSNSFQAIVKIVLKRTDLKLPLDVTWDNLSLIGGSDDGASNESPSEYESEYANLIGDLFNFNDLSYGVDRYYISALVVLILNAIYFIYRTRRATITWPLIFRRQ